MNNWILKTTVMVAMVFYLACQKKKDAAPNVVSEISKVPVYDLETTEKEATAGKTETDIHLSIDINGFDEPKKEEIVPSLTQEATKTVLLPSSSASSEAQPKKEIKVLFVGNSLTYTFDIPGILEKLGTSSNSFHFITEQSTQGGAFLRDHAKNPSTVLLEGLQSIKKIREQNWDFVVLQEQSGSYFMLNDEQLIVDWVPEDAPQLTIPYFCQKQENKEWNKTAACILDFEIKKKGAKTILYMNWPSEGNILSEGSPLNEILLNFTTLAQKLESHLAPVGLIFAETLQACKACKNDPTCNQCPQNEEDLVQRDDVHQTLAGAYLAASVFFIVLTGESPEGLATPDIPLSQELMNFLQKMAWQGYENFKKGSIPISQITYSFVNGELIENPKKGILTLCREHDALLKIHTCLNTSPISDSPCDVFSLMTSNVDTNKQLHCVDIE